MKRAGFLLALGVVAYFLILVFTLPAEQGGDYIESQVPGLSLSALSGSVFNGQAGRISYQGISPGSAQWRFQPLALLTGRVEYQFEFSSPGGPGRANAGVTFAGKAYGHDIDLHLLADDIINQYSPLPVRASGEINLLVETVSMSDGFPSDLDGKAVWKSAALLSPVEMVFGDTVMDLQRVGSELVGVIENEADFKVFGEIAIAPGGKYRIELSLSPDASVSRDTLLLLESTTSVQADGNYLLRSSGQW
ncbi:MAG: type II secretion system protein N [Gammaproteobacteria bacterium]